MILNDSGSGSNHRENHFEPLKRLESVRLTGGHENHLADQQAVELAGNHNLGFAFHYLHQCVEWGRVFAQSLAFVEGEKRHTADGLLDDLAADDGTVLVTDEFGGPGHLGGAGCLRRISDSLCSRENNNHIAMR